MCCGDTNQSTVNKVIRGIGVDGLIRLPDVKRQGISNNKRHVYIYRLAWPLVGDVFASLIR